MKSFAPCPACRRHVRVGEERCPFCKREFEQGELRAERAPDPRLGRAAQLAWKLMLGGVGAVACATTGEGRPQTSHAAAAAPRDAAAVDADADAPIDGAADDGAADAGPADAGYAASPRNAIPIYSATTVAIGQRVYFAPYSSTITALGHRVLDAVAEIIKSHPDYRIDVQGHASKSEGRLAKRLARERAKKARDRLIKLGVPKEHLTVSSHGSEQPLSSEDKGNRCVQFIITAGAPQ